MVENRRVDGAVEEGEDGIRRRRDHRRLDVRHDEVVVGLEDGAGRHGGVVDDHCFLVVIDRLDFVVPGGGNEEEIGVVAAQHLFILRRAAALVDSERVFHGYGAAEAPAGEGSGGEYV